MTSPKARARVADNLHRIADGLSDPKDAEIVRAYAAEVKETEQALL